MRHAPYPQPRRHNTRDMSKMNLSVCAFVSHPSPLAESVPRKKHSLTRSTWKHMSWGWLFGDFDQGLASAEQPSSSGTQAFICRVQMRSWTCRRKPSQKAALQPYRWRLIAQRKLCLLPLLLLPRALVTSHLHLQGQTRGMSRGRQKHLSSHLAAQHGCSGSASKLSTSA